MIFQILIFIGSLCLLCGGADILVRGGGQIARKAGVSGLVVGLTVVSLGTSAPELFISVVAALNGNADLAMGNVVGSNIANIGLVMALTAIAGPLILDGPVLRRDFPVMIAVTLFIFPIIWDLKVTRLEGAGLIAIVFFYLIRVVAASKSDTGRISTFGAGGSVNSPDDSTSKVREGSLPPLVLVVLGICGLTYGSSLLRGSVIYIAQSMGVSELIIALTMVSIGTSLPELATSMMAAIKREKGMAVGNIIGSNIFNLTVVLGTTSAVTPVSVSPEIITKQYPAMLAISVLLVLLGRIKPVISRGQGFILVSAYLAIGGWILF